LLDLKIGAQHHESMKKKTMIIVVLEVLILVMIETCLATDMMEDLAAATVIYLQVDGHTRIDPLPVASFTKNQQLTKRIAKTERIPNVVTTEVRIPFLTDTGWIRLLIQYVVSGRAFNPNYRGRGRGREREREREHEDSPFGTRIANGRPFRDSRGFDRGGKGGP
jgi:hypothetical protein